MLNKMKSALMAITGYIYVCYKIFRLNSKWQSLKKVS